MLVLLSSVLQYHNASVASDEALVVATLLGFEAELVLNVSHGEAMCRIWDRIPSIPGGLSKYAIFAETPKLKTPGYRWASQSFMDSVSRNLTACYQVRRGTETRARPTPRGLVTAYPGFLFRLVSGWRPLCIFGDNDDCADNTDRIIFEMPDDTWAVLEHVHAADESDPIGAATKRYSHAQLNKGSLGLVHTDSRIGPSEQNALLVRIEEMTRATIFASPEKVITLTKLRNDSCQLAKAAQKCAFDLIEKLRKKADGKEEVNGRDQDSSSSLEAVVDERVWRTVEDHPSIRDIIIAENSKNMHDKPNLDLGTVVAKSRKHIYYFGHPW